MVPVRQINIAGGSEVPVLETGIAWAQDLHHKYAALPAENFNDNPALRGGATIVGDVNQDEHFAVWMRPATMPNFRKLWGRIEQDLAAGTVLNVTIANRCVSSEQPVTSTRHS